MLLRSGYPAKPTKSDGHLALAARCPQIKQIFASPYSRQLHLGWPRAKLSVSMTEPKTTDTPRSGVFQIFGIPKPHADPKAQAKTPTAPPASIGRRFDEHRTHRARLLRHERTPGAQCRQILCSCQRALGVWTSMKGPAPISIVPQATEIR